MACLAVFDFDRTVVDDDSDATIIRRLGEKQPPPEWDAKHNDWTPYMSNIFQHAYSAGLSEADILDSISSMRPTPGILELFKQLSSAGWQVLLITDANTVFVGHWIKTHGVKDAVTDIITNRAFFDNGRLYIEPCMHQTACTKCPTNLCKSLALAKWCAGKQFSKVIYSGDGRNDFCPSTNLPDNATVFPRKGYPLDDLIKKTLSSEEPQVRAKVVPWEDANTIIKEVFPEKVIDKA